METVISIIVGACLILLVLGGQATDDWRHQATDTTIPPEPEKQ